MNKFILLFLVAFHLYAQDSNQSAVPAPLGTPSTQKLLFQAHGKGDQIYTCNASETTTSTWTLKAPEAQLLDQNAQPLGRHFAGPTWEAKDGSRVIGKPAASVPSPDPASIPWLRLDAARHEGQGTMSGVLTIQRLNTKGGKAPATGCDPTHAGAELRVPYEADYSFFGVIK